MNETRCPSHVVLAAIVGANLSVLTEDWGVRDMYVASLYDKDGYVIVQSLRHEDQDDAIAELMRRWRDHKAKSRHVAWSLTPVADSLEAVGA